MSWQKLAETTYILVQTYEKAKGNVGHVVQIAICCKHDSECP